MTEPLDMMMLARFAVLPGAADLIKSFSEIPPGPMRDAVIHLARTTAATYTGAAVGQRMPDPIATITAKPLSIATRTGRPAPGGDPQTEAVKMRMAGMSVPDIAQATGLTRTHVYDAFSKARKAGLDVPGKKDRELKGAANKVWHTSLDTLTGQGRAIIAQAAAVRGITPQAYIDRRQLVLKLAMEGAGYEQLLKESGETDQKVVSAWLSAARGAGYNVPYTTFLSDAERAPTPTAQPEPEPVQEAVAAPTGRVFPEAASLGAAAMIVKAAERRNITVAAYQEMREAIVRLRLEGKSPTMIAAMVGQTLQFVKDTIDAAAQRGITIPRLEIQVELAQPSVALRDAG